MFAYPVVSLGLLSILPIIINLIKSVLYLENRLHRMVVRVVQYIYQGTCSESGTLYLHIEATLLVGQSTDFGSDPRPCYKVFQIASSFYRE